MDGGGGGEAKCVCERERESEMRGKGRKVCVCVLERERERVSEWRGRRGKQQWQRCIITVSPLQQKGEAVHRLPPSSLSLCLSHSWLHISPSSHTLEVDQPPLSLTRRAPSDIIHHLWMFALPASRIPGHCLLVKICLLMTRGWGFYPQMCRLIGPPWLSLLRKHSVPAHRSCWEFWDCFPLPVFTLLPALEEYQWMALFIYFFNLLIVWFLPAGEQCLPRDL